MGRLIFPSQNKGNGRKLLYLPGCSNEIYAQRCAEEHRHYFNMKDQVTCPVCPPPSSVRLSKACLNLHFQECHPELNRGVCCECLEMVDMSHNDEELRMHILQVWPLMQLIGLGFRGCLFFPVKGFFLAVGEEKTYCLLLCFRN